MFLSFLEEEIRAPQIQGAETVGRGLGREFLGNSPAMPGWHLRGKKRFYILGRTRIGGGGAPDRRFGSKVRNVGIRI